MTTNAIIMLGPHRSGTSALAGIVHFLGVDLGKDLIEPRPDNPSGFWELKPVVAIHNSIFDTLAIAWHSILPLAENWWLQELIVGRRRAIVSCLRRNFNGVSTWGLKDPRMCRLMPMWHGILAELNCRPCFIHMARHPVEVAESLHRRNGLDSDKSVLLWLVSVLESERETRCYPRVFVTYDQVMANWRETLEKCSSQLGVQWPVAIDDAARDVDAFLRPALRHHQWSEDRRLPSVAGYRLVDRTWNALVEEASGQNPSRLETSLDQVADELRARLGEFPVGPVVKDYQSEIAGKADHAASFAGRMSRLSRRILGRLRLSLKREGRVERGDALEQEGAAKWPPD